MANVKEVFDKYYYYQWIVSLIALANIVQGAVIMFGWFSGSPQIVQFFSQIVPMQFNTGLCFFLAGIGLFLVRFQATASLFGLLVFIVAALTSFQYFGVDFGVDAMFASHTKGAGVIPIVEMAPAASLAFMLSGIAIFFKAQQKHFAFREFLLYCMSMVTLCIGIISFFGYFFVNLPHTYGWGYVTNMPGQTSFGFIILGFGLIVSMFLRSESFHRLRLFLPTTTFFISFALVFIVWQSLLSWERADVTHITQETEYHVAANVQETLSSGKGLEGIKKELEVKHSDLFKQSWEFLLFEKGNLVYASNPNYNKVHSDRWGYQTTLKVKDKVWEFKIWPTEQYLKKIHSEAPALVLSVGIFISLMLALIVEMWSGMLQSKQHAEASNKAKSVFLSSMSHELRTPLNAITGYAQLFEYDEKLTDELRGNAKKIRDAGKHLLSLINDILDLAKIESGKVELEMRSIALNEVMAECLSLAPPLEEKYNVKLFYNMEQHKDVFVRADFIRLKQVLLNLISNGMKYNRDGGTVTVFAKGISNHVQIAVEDTGEGIPKDKLDRLFQPFERLGAERSAVEGTGIGLMITKDLIENMHGEISITSKVGKGSVFWVDLEVGEPYEVKDIVIDLKEVKEKVTKSYTKKILVVEDNPANQAIVLQQLKYLNCEADVANDGVEGFEKYENNDYGLILTDCNMPNMDGYELAQKIRTHEKGIDNRIPVVAFTANAYKEDLEKCYEAGMDDCIVKPVELEILKEKLDEWLSVSEESSGPEHRSIVEKFHDAPVKEKDSSSSTADSIPIDMNIVKKYVGDNKDIQKQMFGKFIETMDEVLRDIGQAYDSKSADDVRFHSHKLKSSSKAMGAMLLSEICLEIETAAKTSEWQVMDAAKLKLEGEAKRVKDYVTSEV
ncbi:MAG: ATP-binding protein [Gammaproteobacteria bacterium]